MSYALSREQFDRPIAGFQLTQEKLANMSVELVKGYLLALHIGRLKNAGAATATLAVPATITRNTGISCSAWWRG